MFCFEALSAAVYLGLIVVVVIIAVSSIITHTIQRVWPSDTAAVYRLTDLVEGYKVPLGVQGAPRTITFRTVQ